RNDGRQAHNDCDRGQGFHHTVQIIGNDRGKGIHHAREDLGIDAGHLDRLLVLGENVLEQILVVLVVVEDLRTLDAFHHHLVRAQRRGKVGQALLVLKQLEQFTVARRFLQLVLDCLGYAVNLSQMREVARRGFQKDVQRKAIPFTRLEQSILPICQYFEHLLIIAANGDNDIAFDQYAQGDRDIGNIAVRLTVGYAHQDKGITLI